MKWGHCWTYFWFSLNGNQNCIVHFSVWSWTFRQFKFLAHTVSTLNLIFKALSLSFHVTSFMSWAHRFIIYLDRLKILLCYPGKMLSCAQMPSLQQYCLLCSVGIGANLQEHATLVTTRKPASVLSEPVHVPTQKRSFPWATPTQYVSALLTFGIICHSEMT